MHFHPKFSANVLNVFTKPCIVGYHHIGFLLDVTVPIGCSFCTWIPNLMFYFVQGQCGVLPPLQGLMQVFFFFMQQLCIGADCICPVLQCPNYTVLRWQGVMTLPLQIEVCVSGLPIHRCTKTAISYNVTPEYLGRAWLHLLFDLLL